MLDILRRTVGAGPHFFRLISDNLRSITRYCLLYIEIENSIEEHPKEKNHRLISCKSEKEVHGYGLKNVRQIVDRYDGTYSYQIKENSFLTCVSFFSNEDVS